MAVAKGDGQVTCYVEMSMDECLISLSPSCIVEARLVVLAQVWACADCSRGSSGYPLELTILGLNKLQFLRYFILLLPILLHLGMSSMHLGNFFTS